MRWWDVIATMSAASALGWYVNKDPASVKAILLPVALLAVVLTAVTVCRRSPL